MFTVLLICLQSGMWSEFGSVSEWNTLYRRWKTIDYLRLHETVLVFDSSRFGNLFQSCFLSPNTSVMSLNLKSEKPMKKEKDFDSRVNLHFWRCLSSSVHFIHILPLCVRRTAKKFSRRNHISLIYSDANFLPTPRKFDWSQDENKTIVPVTHFIFIICT